MNKSYYFGHLPFAVVPVFLCLLLGRTALASHYDLESIGLVEEGIAKQMAQMGIHTTEDLWKETVPGKKATALAKRLKMPTAEVRRVHAFCDLLRLDGVGPKVARVLTAAGVSDLKAVAAQDPTALEARIVQTNNEVEILGKTPEVETLQAWVAQAKSLVAQDRSKRQPSQKTGKSRKSNAN